MTPAVDAERCDDWHSERRRLGVVSGTDVNVDSFDGKVAAFCTAVASSCLVAVVGVGACGKSRLVETAAAARNATIYRLDANAFTVVRDVKTVLH